VTSRFLALVCFIYSVVSSEIPEFLFFDLVVGFFIGVAIPATERAGRRQIGSAIRS
jgi:hypothetical protein